MPHGNKKPNSMHDRDGTGRADRGTDVLMVLPKDLAKEPEQYNFKEFKRDEVFNMMKDWVIAATGAANIDTVMLTMMTDLLEDYSQAESARERGPILDRYHKLAREFGMTPSTRDTIISNTVGTETSQEDDILNGP